MQILRRRVRQGSQLPGCRAKRVQWKTATKIQVCKSIGFYLSTQFRPLLLFSYLKRQMLRVKRASGAIYVYERKVGKDWDTDPNLYGWYAPTDDYKNGYCTICKQVFQPRKASLVNHGRRYHQSRHLIGWWSCRCFNRPLISLQDLSTCTWMLPMITWTRMLRRRNGW